LLLALGAASDFSIPVLAQTTVDDVHVQPRETEKPKTEEVATQTLVSPTLNTHVRPLKVAVDLVLVPVTITDPMNRLVTGLEKQNFQLFEGSSPQEIKSFSSEDAPVSLGVIFDSSRSMSSKMDRAKDAVMEFFKTANPQDEFFMITFSDEPEVVNDFTSSVDEIQGKLIYAVPRRMTALLDAIYMGVSKMRQAKYAKKALLIISDGGDNSSRYTESEIKSAVRESDVQIFGIGIFESMSGRSRTPEEAAGPSLLNELAEQTGGREYAVDNIAELPDIAAKIGVELRNEYILGYTPKNRERDGKYRKVQVKLNQPRGLPPLKAYFRLGYYAPTQ
jgi:Ca-activated chloride channel family protein